MIVCTRLDRLGRSTHDLVVLAKALKERGIELEVLDQQIDTTSMGGRIIFYVLAMLAEVEADLIAERTKDALTFKRQRGIKGGRDFKLTSAQVATVRKLYDDRDMTVGQIAEQFGVSRQTVYRGWARKAAGPSGSITGMARPCRRMSSRAAVPS